MNDDRTAWPAWMQREIATGLAELVVLGLESTPASELVRATAMVWCKAVSSRGEWDEAADAPRFRTAFTRLARESRRWPSPADFLGMLPARETLRALTRQIDHEACQRALADVFEKMRAKGFPIDDGSLLQRLGRLGGST